MRLPRLGIMRWGLSLSVGLLAAALAAQEAPLRVTVRLVNILATVRTNSGDLARSLAQNDFEVRDEGKPQSIRLFARESDLPLRIALLVDTSLSTAKDLKFEQDSAVRFVHSILRPQDRISVFSFNDQITQVSRFSSDTKELEKALRSLRAEGATSLFDAIYLASDELKRQSGRKVMILVTDGGDTTSATKFHPALREAQEADAVIYSVVIVPIKNNSFRDIGGEHALQLLSEGTGGRWFMPDSPAQLDPVFAAIGEELRTQYVLAYYAPPDAIQGDYRHVEVRVKSPGFTVQARKGYYLQDR